MHLYGLIYRLHAGDRIPFYPPILTNVNWFRQRVGSYGRLWKYFLFMIYNPISYKEFWHGMYMTEWLRWDEFIELSGIFLSSKMLSERDAIVRESSIILSSVSRDARLTTALMAIEELTKQLQVEKLEHLAKVGSVTCNFDYGNCDDEDDDENNDIANDVNDKNDDDDNDEDDDDTDDGDNDKGEDGGLILMRI